MLVRGALAAALLAFPFGGALEDEDDAMSTPDGAVVDTVVQPVSTPTVPRAKPAFEPPTSIPEYRLRMHLAGVAIDRAVTTRRWSEIRTNRSEIRALDHWYATQTHMFSPPMFGAGVVMVTVGVAALLFGIPMSALGGATNSGDGWRAAGAGMSVTGGILALVGIPMIVAGVSREMGAKTASGLQLRPNGIAGTF